GLGRLVVDRIAGRHELARDLGKLERGALHEETSARSAARFSLSHMAPSRGVICSSIAFNTSSRPAGKRGTSHITVARSSAVRYALLASTCDMKSGESADAAATGFVSVGGAGTGFVSADDESTGGGAAAAPPLVAAARSACTTATCSFTNATAS